MDVVVNLLIVLGLVLANGFFVAAEFSLVAMRRSRVEQMVAEGRGGAAAVQRAVHSLDTYLAATQLGITLASLALGWVGEPFIAEQIEGLFHALPPAAAVFTTHAVASGIAFGCITTLHIVLGELAPKSLALQRGEAVALWVARPLHLFLVVFRPAIHLLNNLGNLVVRMLGLHGGASVHESAHSTEELKLLLATSHLDEPTRELAQRAFDFGEFAARQVMVPRVDMVAVSRRASLDAVLTAFSHSHHARLPVYDEDIDHVVGIIRVHDVMHWLHHHGRQASDWSVEALARPALAVPEFTPARTLLAELRARGEQVAVLLDEYGGTSGLVTIHDVLERLVGPLPDAEGAAAAGAQGVQVESDGTSLVSGRMLVCDFADRFFFRPQGEVDADTLGGLIQLHLGRVPALGEEVEVGGCRLRVEAVERLRVKRIRVLAYDSRGEPSSRHLNDKAERLKE